MLLPVPRGQLHVAGTNVTDSIVRPTGGPDFPETLLIKMLQVFPLTGKLQVLEGVAVPQFVVHRIEESRSQRSTDATPSEYQRNQSRCL